MSYKELSASALLHHIINGHGADSLTLQELKDLLHTRGFGLLMLLFSLPIALPLPYPPGFTAVVGVPLLLFSLQMTLGFSSPKLPHRVGKVTVKRETLSTVVAKVSPYLHKVEYCLKPRMLSITSRAGERMVGFVSFLCAISIALPIPLGNAVPALGIVLMALGLLNKDGLLVIAGMVASFLGIMLASTVVALGADGVLRLLNG